MGVEGAHLECSKCREAPRPSPAYCHSEKMSLCPTSPAGPPVDVGMRIDVASIDMVSEVNMVSGLGTAGSRAYADAKWMGPRALCVSLAVISPQPGVPRRVRSPLWHTHSVAPGLYFRRTHTYTHTHTGYCGVPGETCSALFGEGRVTGSLGSGGVESERYFSRVSFGLPRRRAPSAGGRAACTGVLGPWSAAAFSPGQVPAAWEPAGSTQAPPPSTQAHRRGF